MKYGFSLAEAFLVLVITGIISALTIPIIGSQLSYTNKVAYQTARQLIQTSLSNMDTSILINGTLTNNATTPGYTFRFCNEFMSSLNLIGTGSCSNTSSAPATPNFITTNRMFWYGFENDFNSYGNMTVQVDINGNNPPNTSDTSVSSRDILSIVVYNNETLAPPAVGSLEASYLQ